MRDAVRHKRRVAVTGGAGFIGSNLLRHLVPTYPEYLFVNIDCLTYAGNPANLDEVEGASNYAFEQVDICDRTALDDCLGRHGVDGIIHLAAESHVDRSINQAAPFVRTNILGTYNLLEAVLTRMKTRPIRMLHVSTDEVFGSLGETGLFTETTPYAPNSPYSASKAAADHLVRAYQRTYSLDLVTTNCSNNYGPCQHAEKLVPVVIKSAMEGKPIPVYGDGLHIRDWLHVTDHCRALALVFHRGVSGRTYNIGANNELATIDMVRRICRVLDDLLGGGPREKLITLVADRPGHDRRYAIDASYIRESLGWKPAIAFEEGLRKTILWYLEHPERLAHAEGYSRDSDSQAHRQDEGE